MSTRLFMAAYALLMSAGIVGVVACKDDPTDSFLTVSETPVAATAAAGTYSISVSSNGEWTAAVEDAASHSWCTLTGATGKNDGTFTVSIAENTDTAERSATVKITMNGLTKRVPFHQAPADEEWYLTVDETTVVAAAEAGTYPVEVSSNGEWTAAVEDADAHPWCTLTNAAGVNSGTVTVNVADNVNSTARSAVILFTLDTLVRRVPVEQVAGAFFTIDPPAVTATADSAGYAITAYSNMGAWTVAVKDPDSHPWCTLSALSGIDTTAITVTVEKNPQTAPRTAVVVFTVDTIVRRCTVTQAAATPFLTVNETPRDIPSIAAFYPIDVESNGAWTVAVDNAAAKPWCTLSAATGEGNGSINVQWETNQSGAERIATVRFTMGSIVKSVQFTQAPEDLYLKVVDEEGVEISQINVSDAGVIQKISVQSNSTWKATRPGTATWVSITGMGIGERTGDGAFNAEMGANPLTTERSVEITVALTNGSISKTVTLIQAGTAPVMDFADVLSQVSAAVQNKTVQIIATVEWTAEITTGSDWCSLTNATGTGNGQVEIAFTENTGTTERQGEITLRSTSHPTLEVKTLTLRQSGAGNAEQGITINGVTWASRNLEAPGVWAESPTAPGKFFQFDNKAAFANIGALSNDETANWRTTSRESSDWQTVNNPCPDGWRVPTDTEMSNLNKGTTSRKKVTEGSTTIGFFFGIPTAISSGPTLDDPKGCVFFPATNSRTSPTSSGVGGSNNNKASGYYWTGTQGLSASYGKALTWTTGNPALGSMEAVNKGYAVRCVKQSE